MERRDVIVIGAGAMGRAMAAGLARGDSRIRAGLAFADAIPAVAESAALEIGGRAVHTGEAARADLVVLAVKPKDVEPALTVLAPAMAPDSVLLSVVAGWTLDRLAAHLPGRAIVRTMPNTPALIGKGITGMVATAGVLPQQREAADAIMRAVGATVWLDDEALIDPVHHFPPPYAVIVSRSLSPRPERQTRIRAGLPFASASRRAIAPIAANACAVSSATTMPSERATSRAASSASVSVAETYVARPVSRSLACSGPTPG